MLSLAYRTTIQNNCPHHFVRYLSQTYSSSASYQLLREIRQIPNRPTIKLTDLPYNIRIQPNDVHNANNFNGFRALLFSDDPNGKCPTLPESALRVDIDEDTISVRPAAGDQTLHTQLTCQLEVPVDAQLDVQAIGPVHVERLHSDRIVVRSMGAGGISTRDLNGLHFAFETLNGGFVRCAGNILANSLSIEALGSADVRLGNVRGNRLRVFTDLGAISTEACYAQRSQFVTIAGRLRLANVHNDCEVQLLGGGSTVDVTGFHGRLRATLNNTRRADFQLSEITGDSFVKATQESNCRMTVNVSDAVLTANAIRASVVESATNRLEVDDALKEFAEAAPNVFDFRSGSTIAGAATLLVRVDGQLRLGRMSWTDMMKLKLNAK